MPLTNLHAGEVLAEGWHRAYGGLHAETDALSSCTGDPSGATMYVTLEPCCHQGKQPPCTDAIIRAGIAKVVVGMTDPNPLVAGKGLKILREHGIEVVHGLLEPEIRRLNRVFIKFITERRPWVTLKWAMTMDGRVAAIRTALRTGARPKGGSAAHPEKGPTRTDPHAESPRNGTCCGQSITAGYSG